MYEKQKKKNKSQLKCGKLLIQTNYKGSGVTGCINKLACAIEKWPNYNVKSTVVFISIFEHNSNILIWKEKGNVIFVNFSMFCHKNVKQKKST